MSQTQAQYKLSIFVEKAVKKTKKYYSLWEKMCHIKVRNDFGARVIFYDNQFISQLLSIGLTSLACKSLQIYSPVKSIYFSVRDHR